MYVDPLFHHLVVHHCDLETLCIAGHRAGHKFLCICQFTLITNGHLAANNSERPAIYCVRKEIRNWNVYYLPVFSLSNLGS